MAFIDGMVDPTMLEVLLVLISKMDHLTTLQEFRPTGL